MQAMFTNYKFVAMHLVEFFGFQGLILVPEGIAPYGSVGGHALLLDKNWGSQTEHIVGIIGLWLRSESLPESLCPHVKISTTECTHFSGLGSNIFSVVCGPLELCNKFGGARELMGHVNYKEESMFCFIL